MPRIPGALPLASALVAAAALSGAGEARAGDAAAGRRKAVACQACHGLDGLSKLPEAPNLAGQVEPYLVKALTEFRGGVRKNEVMSVAAKDLSETDIADLAAYYSGIQVDVVPPS
ncbi:c-type cytochrome [Methylobacterium sp. JK268]